MQDHKFYKFNAELGYGSSVSIATKFIVQISVILTVPDVLNFLETVHMLMLSVSFILASYRMGGQKGGKIV
jgi:hypothetical protein